MLSVLIFLIVLSVLVLGHELGHYVAARLCGVKAEEFGYGFPPRIGGIVKQGKRWKWVKGNDHASYENTVWSLNWLPLGGFVRFKGEDAALPNETNSFASKGIFARLFILAAGVLMNWIMAFFIFSIGFTIGVPAQTSDLPRGAVVQNQQVQIVHVMAESGASLAGLMPGDLLINIDGQDVRLAEDVQKKLGSLASQDQSALFMVQRGKEVKTFTAHASYAEEAKRPVFGIELADTGLVRLPLVQAFGQGALITIAYTKLIIIGFVDLIRDLFGARHLLGSVTGPIGIAVVTGQVAEQGLWPLAQFAALLSINLAVINFLPIPALDGGRALFVLIESIRRRKLHPNFEGWIHRMGFFLLMALVVIVTFKDIRQYGGIVWHGIKGLVGL